MALMGLELITNQDVYQDVIGEHAHLKEWEVMTNYGNEPNLTLSDLYDKDVVYTSRPSYISNPWLKPDEHQSNFLTGRSY